MADLVNVILPVFLVIGFGYFAAWRRMISEQAIQGLMTFAQNFAIPCLLFVAMTRIDLGTFNLPLLSSFYLGAFACFLLGMLGARLLFHRSPTDSVAVGFAAFFSNSVLLGLAITERAYGPEALSGNYAIVAVHPPILYTVGVVAMEIARAAGNGRRRSIGGNILRSLATNPLLIGIVLGFAVNVGQVPLPGPLTEALSLIVRAAIPIALFGLGGVLIRYRPAGDAKAIAWVTVLSLIVHPSITYTLATKVFALDTAQLRSAVLTAAMAPGLNTYLFANMYGAARRVAASSVLVATTLSILTAWVWLSILP